LVASNKVYLSSFQLKAISPTSFSRHSQTFSNNVATRWP